MKIESLLSEKYIALNLELESKEQVIENMLSIVSEHSGVKDVDRLRADVLKREREMSTGIGKKIALPHAKTGAVTHPVLAVATLKQGINFDAIDGEPVEIIFLLATPEDMLAEHLKLLGRITRLAGREDIRARILHAESSSGVLELFREEEKDLPQI
ncbi:PTS sugar transporter subunit IIA [Chlorobium sp. N1]|uniref:PTS sugar transporter subunit IIA n=1 Tax=Chlorobium sp. N1 TaxID=2491138 RepID=UPI00103C103D|nr:PTS sugar transporter subunit IIA [Chlorobium sp. N1]TCD48913.1 PTS sugar transporter subunit IIA [Chlorobium sp. N1]